MVDLIAAEDTRHSAPLLQHLGVTTRMIAYHDHNETGITAKLLSALKAGKSIALISDAGTPLISDPGYQLVHGAKQMGVRVIPVPGPSALITALCASGLFTDRFRFEGFLPARPKARIDRLNAIRSDSSTLVFYEAPHRIEAAIADMSDILGSQRSACIARELTKTFEQIRSATLSQLASDLHNKKIAIRGEFVIMIEGCREVVNPFDDQILMQVLLKELPPSKAASIASELTGKSKRLLYAVALGLKSEI